MRREQIAVVSSGDPEKDQREIDEFMRSSSLIEKGMCPNGCGLMTPFGDYNMSCSSCNFSYFCNSKIDVDGKVNYVAIQPGTIIGRKRAIRGSK